MTDKRSSHLQAVIFECPHIRNILKYCTFNSVIIVDLDNTLLRPTQVEDLGSDQWFRKILERAMEKIPHRPRALHSAISLNNAIQKHIKIKPVEPDTPQIIHVLQDLNLTTIAVTARRYDIADVTIHQLHEIDIHMSKDDMPVIHFQVEGRDVYFKNNILFCDGANKGLCIAELRKLRQVNCPSIVMLDDNLENLQNVSAVMSELGVKFYGFRYSALDQRVADFDVERANVRLKTFSLFFSKSVANIARDIDLDVSVESPAQVSVTDLRKPQQAMCS